jgi:hypothetical protein
MNPIRRRRRHGERAPRAHWCRWRPNQLAINVTWQPGMPPVTMVRMG